MLISYNWLRELTGTERTPRELAESLTMVGLAVDAVREAGDDYVLELDITSNRPDCLSHFGVAREVAVMDRSPVRLPEAKIKNVAFRAEDYARVEVLDKELCPRYAARVVRGVKVAPSPQWLVKRLEAIGQRAINNVTDITNLVLHEQGQPLHAFDLSKLIERKIIVRPALDREKIITLDGTERELDANMLVIADALRPVAIAGVMGGAETAVYDETQDVLIESAYFEPSQVRRTARALGLHTEASYHFERGADPEAVLRAQARAVALICEIAGGTASENAIDIRLKDFAPTIVNFRLNRFASLTGLQVEIDEAVRILRALGFTPNEDGKETVSGKTSISFVAPSWRIDIEREEDLIEEVARHTGYDRIATELPASSVAGEYRAGEERMRAARRALVGCGYSEAINFSFIDASADDRFQILPTLNNGRNDGERFVTLSNPIIEGAARMRPTLLAGLLETVRHNFNHGTRDVRLFEKGRIFAANNDGDEKNNRPREREALALVATGGALESGVAMARRELDFYDLKGALEAAAEATGAPALSFEAADDVGHLRPGQAARIRLNNELIGTIGLLGDEIAQAFKFRQRVFVAEIDFQMMLAAETSAARYAPLARFPSVVRDASFIVNRRVTFQTMRQAVLDLRLENCRRIELVDVYEGESLGEDARSLTLRVEYRANDRTLRDEEVDSMQTSVVGALEKKFNAKIRG
jgi:phenylalanyl-tRNA synthetase beta chain